MANNIKKLQHQGADIYPITHEEAVFDNNGVSIGEKIRNLEDNISYAKDIETYNIKSIAHRGFSSEAPENTIPAFELAGLKGCWGAECDIHETSDGKFVIMHNDTVDEMTNGTGKISEMTLEQVKALKVDSGHNISLYHNLRVPTLEEYLICCKRFNLVPIIEVKSIRNYQNFINEIINIGFERKCIIISFDNNILTSLRNLNKNIRLQTLTYVSVEHCLEHQLDVDIQWYNELLTKDFVNLMHTNNIEVNVYTVDDESVLNNVANLGVDYITTNKMLLDTQNASLSEFDLINYNIENFKVCRWSSDGVYPDNYTILESHTRGANLKPLYIKGCRKCKLVFDSNVYKATVHCYDVNNNFLGDLGWFNSDEERAIYKNVEYAIVYFGTANNTAFTEEEIANLNCGIYFYGKKLEKQTKVDGLLATEDKTIVGAINELDNKINNLDVNQYINVKDYGALGDGVTDDTEAFNRAIAAGSYVKVPEGVYRVGDLNLKKGLILDGSCTFNYGRNDEVDKTVLKAIDGAEYVLKDVRGASIQNIHIDGNAKASHGIWGGRGSDGTDGSIEVYNCRISNCNYGLHGFRCGSRIERCNIDNNNYGMYTLVDCRVINNTIHSNVNSGLHLYDSNDNQIANNKIEWNKGSGIHLEKAIHNLISNNTIDRNSLSGIYTRETTDTTIIGNVIRRNLEYNLRLNGSNNFTVTGNSFVRGNSMDNQSGTDVPEYHVYPQSYGSLTFVGNTANGSVDKGFKPHPDYNGGGNVIQNNKGFSDVEKTYSTLTTENKTIPKAINELDADIKNANQYKNVKDFGAVGDGVTDDTAALQSAIDAENNLFLDGEYKITGPLYVRKSNVHLKGSAKARLVYHGLGMKETYMLFVGAENNVTPVENVKIENIQFDATNQEYKGGADENNKTLTSPNAYDKGLIGIEIKYCRNVKVENCILNEIYGTGIRTHYSNTILVDGNTLYNCSGSNAFGADSFGDGIVFFACFNCKAINNTLFNKRVYKSEEIDYRGVPVKDRQCGRSGLEFEYCLDKLWSGDDPTKYCVDYELFSSKKQNGCVFSNNYVYGYSKGIHLEDNVKGAVIKGNILINNHIGVLHTTGCDGMILSENYFDSNNVGPSPQASYGQHYCAVLLGDMNASQRSFGKSVLNNRFYGDSGGIFLNGLEAVISGNIFKCEGNPIRRQSQENMDDGDNSYGSRKMIVTNNYFEIIGKPIYLPWSSYIMISDNVITGENNDNSAGFRAGIQMTADGYYINVNNNTFRDIAIDMTVPENLSYNVGIKFYDNQFVNTVINGVKAKWFEFKNNLVIVSDALIANFCTLSHLKTINICGNRILINTACDNVFFIKEATTDIEIQDNELNLQKKATKDTRFVSTNWYITGVVKIINNILRKDEGEYYTNKVFAYLSASWAPVNPAKVIIYDNIGKILIMDKEVKDTNNIEKTEFASLTTEDKTVVGAINELDVKYTDIIDDISYTNIKEFGAVGDGVTDDTTAFVNALAYIADTNNNSLYIPSGKYKITQPIEQAFSYAPKIFGDGQERTMIMPYDIPEGEVVFKFYGKQFDGGSIQGLRITDLTINMQNSNAHALQLTSLHDMSKIDSISITNVYGHALVLSSNHSADSISYNCSESLLIINSQFKGRAYDSNVAETKYALLKAKNSEVEGSVNMVNEIVIMSCRFYGESLKTITSNNMPLNKRSAIEISTYAVGWSIHDCMFNTIYGAPAIMIGYDQEGNVYTCRGHRIFSNCFENCGAHGEFEDTYEYIRKNCLIFIHGADFATQNSVTFNRFEEPVTNKYKHVISAQGNYINEPGLNPCDIYASKGCNQIIALGNAKRNNNTIPGNQYKNTYTGSYGEFTVHSSKMMIASRKDVKTNSGAEINQQTKPELLFGCNIDDTQANKTCGFRMLNEHYEDPKLGYVINNSIVHTLNHNGTINLKNLESEPAGSNLSVALINEELKFKKDNAWQSICTEKDLENLYYDNREYAEYSFTFDGEVTGKEYIEIPDTYYTGYIVKIADVDSIGNLNLVEGNYVLRRPYADYEYDFFNGDCFLYKDENMFAIDNTIRLVINETPDYIYSDKTLTPGLWLSCIVYSSSKEYVPQVNYKVVASGEIKNPIKAEYLAEQAAGWKVPLGEVVSIQDENYNDVDVVTGAGAEIFNCKLNVASGHFSHAEGFRCIAKGNYSHAEGDRNTAAGISSHAEGQQTKAVGVYSHAEGYFTRADGKGAHASGYCTKATGEYSHVSGKNNIEDKDNKYVHIVGNGTSSSSKDLSNAYTLDWNGNAWFAGNVSINGTPANAKDLVNKAYVDDQISAITGTITELVEISPGVTNLSNKEFALDENMSLSDNDYQLIGDGNAIIKGNVCIEFNNCNVYFKDIIFEGIDHLKFVNCNNVLFENCTFQNIIKTGAWCINCNNVSMIQCIAQNIGENLTLDEITYLGGICFCDSCDNVKMQSNNLTETYGQGAIRLTNCNSINISNNDIENVAYRAISIFNSEDHVVDGIIYKNKIYNCGSINKHNTGVACNGIFTTDALENNITVSKNFIKNVYENGIEGNFAVIEDNYIENTGMNTETHPTPSTEGIWSDAKKVINNTIVNPHRYGIYLYSTGDICNREIVNNTIIKGDNTIVEDAIVFNAQGEVYNNKFMQNNTIGFDYCINIMTALGQLQNFNISCNNTSTGNIYRNKINNMKFLNSGDVVVESSVLSSSNLSPFVHKNCNVSGENPLLLTATNVYGAMITYDIHPTFSKYVYTLNIRGGVSNSGVIVRFVPYGDDGTLDYSVGISKNINNNTEFTDFFTAILDNTKKYQLQIVDQSKNTGDTLELYSVLLERVKNSI